MTYEEVVQRIILQAQLGGVELKGYDPTPLVEAFFPSLLRKVGEMYAANDRTRHLLRDTSLVDMSLGRGTVGANVLVRYLETDSTFYDAADLTKEYAYVKDFRTFMQPLDSRLGYYTVRGDNEIFQREPGEEFDNSLSFNGEMTLITPSIPSMPATFTDHFFLPSSAETEIITTIIDMGAEMLRGAR